MKCLTERGKENGFLQHLFFFLTQKPRARVGQLGPYDSGRGVGEFFIVFSIYRFVGDRR